VAILTLTTLIGGLEQGVGTAGPETLEQLRAYRAQYGASPATP
jgi:hypothetical protein